MRSSALSVNSLPVKNPLTLQCKVIYTARRFEKSAPRAAAEFFTGRARFDAEAALTAIRGMETSVGVIKEKGRFENARQQAEVLQVYEEAIGQLRQKLPK